MNKRVLGLAVLALLGYGAIRYYWADAGKSQPELNVQVSPSLGQANGHALHVTKDQLYKGTLLLVNKDHPVPKAAGAAAAIQLAQHQEKLTGFGLLDNSIRLSSNLLDKFSTMVEAAERDGVNHFMLSSGYRDNEEQDRLYRQMGAQYAMPAGYSEHNLGLSVDIGSTLGEMGHAPEGKWLMQNAWKYGFILRYPKDKANLTGIQYEPWHFRYVGLPHSAIMQEKGWVLEEYLDFLQQERHLSVTLDDHTYAIAYYPVTALANIRVPANRRYELSGDNVDGVIVTVYD